MINFAAIAAPAASTLLSNLAGKLWDVINKGDGTATIKLDNGYKLELNEKSSEIKIINTRTREETRIWGDPHVDYNKDGKTDFDFWGSTTFKLEDGTKITINTVPFKGNNKGMFVADNVVVTKGQQSLVINGLSQNKLGDMKIVQGLNGKLLDAAVSDGKLTLRENPNGVGWLNEKGRMVTQTDGNKTKSPTEKSLPFNDQLAVMFYGNSGAGQAKGKGKGAGSWYEAMANALGKNLDAQAKEIMDLSQKASSPGGKDDPSNMTALTTASQRMGFMATGSMTAINSVGDALNTAARKS